MALPFEVILSVGSGGEMDWGEEAESMERLLLFNLQPARGNSVLNVRERLGGVGIRDRWPV